jgi:hypothetical protein
MEKKSTKWGLLISLAFLFIGFFNLFVNHGLILKYPVFSFFVYSMIIIGGLLFGFFISEVYKK